jgi:hypothetical protein
MRPASIQRLRAFRAMPGGLYVFHLAASIRLRTEESERGALWGDCYHPRAGPMTYQVEACEFGAPAP